MWICVLFLKILYVFFIYLYSFVCICWSFACFLSNFYVKLYTYNTFHMSSNNLPVCLCFIFKVFACVNGWFYDLHDFHSIISCKIRNENQIQKWLTVIDTNQFGYGSVLNSMRMNIRIYMLHESFHVTCYNF